MIVTCISESPSSFQAICGDESGFHFLYRLVSPPTEIMCRLKHEYLLFPQLIVENFVEGNAVEVKNLLNYA